MAETTKHRGVFCIETVWYETQDHTSMRPLLELLRDGYLQVPFVHRTAMTKDEFTFHVVEWLTLDPRRFPILYLGYHGEHGAIQLGGGGFMDENELEFHEVAERLVVAGRCANRVVHFASCSTLDIDQGATELFLDQTGASAVSGYAEPVDWVEAATFDMLYIKRMQSGGARSLTPAVMRRIRDGTAGEWGLLESGNSPYIGLAKHLGFRLEVP